MLGRRTFLTGTAAIGGALMAGVRLPVALAASPPLLRIETRTIEVNKKAATVFSVSNRNGKNGIIAAEGDRFTGHLLNASKDPLAMHWHGQVLAAHDQDRARPRGGELAPAAADDHDFQLTPGTHWMHSHSLTEQQLLASPMVAVEKDAGDVQNVIVMLHDFAFRTPQEILAELVGPSAHGGHGSAALPPPTAPMQHGSGMHQAPGTGMQPGLGAGGPGMMMGTVHANDVRYDAFLANDRTLDDPEVVRVEKGGRVRLRIINGGTATAFFISTGALKSTCIAVDGSPCQPVEAGQYPLAQGQRIDLIVEIPKGGGTFPILAQVEDDPRQTGLVLATAGAAVAKISGTAKDKAAMAGLGFEQRLRAAKPLVVRKPDKVFIAML
ncbi:MAG: multicopper oxidase domain-containing protein, partial [Xanthobacteraceae bacterium]